jgi:2-oxoglutarate dehydrogenase E1 component
MARQGANEAFAATSFLYGANAPYLEDMRERYVRDPASVDAEWRAFFADLKDAPDADGKPSWQRSDWPPLLNGDLTAALDGNWGAGAAATTAARIKAGVEARGGTISESAVHQATRDSIRALMMIRAYRVRGHFHANLDPLALEAVGDEAELDPASYGFTDADLDRKIFIDNVLGLEFATVREMIDLLRRTYCSTIGIEFMHIS